MLTQSKNLHLAVSAIAIFIVSLVYGLFPGIALPLFFDFKVDSIDLKEVFRATMGLYIAMAALWSAGTVKPLLWRAATISNVFFMTGLASGRIISLLVDGMPSLSFLIGIVAEFGFAIWGLKNLEKHPEIEAK
jgi:uncharacterized membrane protein